MRKYATDISKSLFEGLRHTLVLHCVRNKLGVNTVSNRPISIRHQWSDMGLRLRRDNPVDVKLIEIPALRANEPDEFVLERKVHALVQTIKNNVGPIQESGCCHVAERGDDEIFELSPEALAKNGGMAGQG
jgi:hypothetical protein